MPELVLPTHEHGAYATEGPFGCGWGEDFVGSSGVRVWRVMVVGFVPVRFV